MTTTYWIGHTLFRAAARGLFSYEVVGAEKLCEGQPTLIACNHESFLDPPLVGIAYDEAVYYLARKTLFRGPTSWLYPRWNAIPVDQERPDMSSLKRIIKLLRQGERVVIFPEGARTLDGNLQPAGAGTGLVVAKSRVPVLPVRLFGAREALPRGSARLKLEPITLVVGDPIEFSEAELGAKSREGYQAISDRVMAAIAALEDPRA